MMEQLASGSGPSDRVEEGVICISPGEVKGEMLRGAQSPRQSSQFVRIGVNRALRGLFCNSPRKVKGDSRQAVKTSIN